MATTPKKVALKPAAALQPEPLASPHFGLLVSGAACAIQAQKMAQAVCTETPGPTEAQRAAWALLTSPRRALLTAFMHSHGNLLANLEVRYTNPAATTIFPGYAPDEIELLTRAVDDCAQDARRQAEAPSFKAAARAYAPLFGTPGSDGTTFTYPLSLLALRSAKTALEGKRRHSFIGVEIERQVLRNSTETAQLLADPATPATERAAVQTELALRDGILDQLELAAPRSGTLKNGIPHLNEESKALHFAVLTDQLNDAPSYLNGEFPLPSTQQLSLALDQLEQDAVSGRIGWINEPLLSSFFQRRNAHGYKSNVKAEASLTQARQAAHNMSCSVPLEALFIDGVNAHEKIGLVERHQRLSPQAGPLAQATGGPWDQEGTLALSSVLLASTRALYAMKTLTAETVYDSAVRDNFIINRLNQLTKDEDFAEIDRICIAAFESDSHELNAHVEKLKNDYEKKRRYGTGSVRKIKPDFVPSFGKLGEGMAGFFKLLSGEDERLGVSQWGTSAARIAYASNNAARGEVIPFLEGGGRDELIKALARLDRALFDARLSFCRTALSEAAKSELEWFEKQGIADAWSQAFSSGPVTTQSLAWALAHPARESLDSDTPMERLAVLSARSLGLRPDADGLLEGAYREQLREMGASPEGLDLVASDADLRNVLSTLSAGMSSPDKNARSRFTGAFEFCVQGLTAAAQTGLSGYDASEMFVSYVARTDNGFADPSPGAFKDFFNNLKAPPECFALESSSACDRADGIGPGYGSISVDSPETARLAREMSQAKREHYPVMLRALAQDWRQTREDSARMKLSETDAISIARRRAGFLASEFPKNARLDWRKRPFEGHSAWEIMGATSPRFSAAVADAQARGGLIGIWCAGRAEQLALRDAADGNDLIARCREHIKQTTGMSDGAWKIAIKTPEGLQLMDKGLNLRGADLSRHAWTSKWPLLPEMRMDRDAMEKISLRVSEGTMLSKDPRRFGMALSFAAALGTKPDILIPVVNMFTVSSRFCELFSETISSVRVRGPEGAAFFEQEAHEKSKRMPKVFQEALKRYEKLAADYKAGPKPGSDDVVPEPQAALASEATDLCDWISGSEHGVWQTIPAEPTWGQLRRLSKSWHDERHAVELDKAARKNAADERLNLRLEEAQNQQNQPENPGPYVDMPTFKPGSGRPNPFTPGSGVSWAKIIGRYQLDGWEAVEMLTAKDLTEEGAAMAHCVSSYSSSCRNGTHRIFSIRLNGERKSTLEIRSENPLHQEGLDAIFKISQNKGKHNQAVVNKATLDFCQATLDEVSKAWPVHCKKIAEAEAKDLIDREKRMAHALNDRLAAQRAARGVVEPEALIPLVVKAVPHKKTKQAG